jgi:tetratricopeptide (TPR) repeat protein
VWFYLYKALWPLNLMFVYPRWSIDASNPLSYLPGLLAATVGVVCWHYRRQWGRPVLFALGYFVVLLLPVLGFIDIYFMRYSLVADHWQYFSILGPIALLAAALAAAGEPLGKAHPRLGVALGGLTWKQSHIYADQETLWQDTLAKNPACWLAYNNLGCIRLNQGQMDEAIRQCEEAIRLNPDYALAHFNLGTALDKQGQTDQAIRQYEEAIRLEPDNAEAHNNLGDALDKDGQIDGAITQFQDAIRLQPGNADAHYNLGNARGKKGQVGEAISQYQEAIRLKPDYAEAHNNLGTALYQ